MFGSVDVLSVCSQPEAVEIEGQAEQEGLAGLGVGSSVGSAAKEFALPGGENAFDLGAFSILFCGEVLANLKAHTGCSATGAAFGRVDALSLKLLAVEGMETFRITSIKSTACRRDRLLHTAQK